MKKIKTLLIITVIHVLFISGLFAEETQIAKDMKTALKNYAGMTELQNRGFRLEMFDTAETGEDIYNILLPYMIVDGVPLDNAISFYDQKNYSTYSFKQHYSVHFTDDYGTKQELIKKGYKENEVFPYYSKGKDVYRGGRFVWESAETYNSRWNKKQFPPLVEDNFIYFFPQFYTEKFFPDYWKTATSKDFIIIDFRWNDGGDYPASLFLDYLDQVNYKGQLILIIDSSANTGEWFISGRMTKWQNGKEVPRKFKCTSVGQNTLGMSNFSGQWQNYSNGNLSVWGIREKENQWKKFDEGVGIMPDIWAENAEDIIKTLEYVMNIKDLGRSTKAFINYISNKRNIQLPDNLLEIKDEKEFFNKFADFFDIQTQIYKKTSEHKVISSLFYDNYLHQKYATKNLSFDEYLSSLKHLYETTFLENNRFFYSLGGYEIDLNVFLTKEPEHHYSEKEIKNLYDSLGIKMVDIPGKNYQMMSTEVTQKLFETIMGFNPSTIKNPDHPVETVDFLKAFYFCNKLSEKFGYTPVYAINGEYDVTKWDFPSYKISDIFSRNVQADGFRIPTIYEWYFAAKGGEDYEYAGSDNIDEVAWYSENSGNKHNAVAQKKPNGYGLYDMSGNVAELFWQRNDWQGNKKTYEIEQRFIGGNTSRNADGKPNTYYCKVKEVNFLGGNMTCQYHGFRIVRTIPTRQLKPLTNKECQSTLNSIKKNMIEIPEIAIKVLNTEVTQKMYLSLMEDNPSCNKGFDNPVENVSFFDAIYFCNKLSTKLGYTPVYSLYGETDVTKWNYTPDINGWLRGKIIQNPAADGFRLPLPEEWDYISKDEDNSNLVEKGWFKENSNNQTHPVAQKKSNTYGLYDIDGNVSEILWKINDDYNCGSIDGTNYSGNSYPHNPAEQSDNVGFRLVQTDFKHRKNVSNKEKIIKVKDVTLTLKEIPEKKILMLNTKVTPELYKTVMGYTPKDLFEKKEDYLDRANWYNAIYFCNKLSEMCGLKPVYSFNEQTKTSKWNYTPTDGTHDLSAWDRTNQLKAEVTQNLKANGFRLPTLDEWLYAANNGKYTPNALGLYDMLNKEREWVWDKPEQENLRYVCPGTNEEEYSGFLAEVDFPWVSFRIVCSTPDKL